MLFLLRSIVLDVFVRWALYRKVMETWEVRWRLKHSSHIRASGCIKGIVPSSRTPPFWLSYPSPRPGSKDVVTDLMFHEEGVLRPSNPEHVFTVTNLHPPLSISIPQISHCRRFIHRIYISKWIKICLRLFRLYAVIKYIERIEAVGRRKLIIID